MTDSIEIAVGQVWRDEDGDYCNVVALTSKEVCHDDPDGGLYVFTCQAHLNENTLVKHQNGADINTDKYDYAVGKMGNEWYAGPDGWRTCRAEVRAFLFSDTLTRTPKVKELPYVDCEVDQDGMTYELPSSYTCNLLTAISDRKFIGYVYDDGVLLHLPRFYVDEKTPAQIPTHVRFAR